MSYLHPKRFARLFAGGLLLTLTIALAACGGAAAPAAAPIQAAAPTTRAVANTPVAASSGKGGDTTSAATATGASGRPAATAVPVKNPAGGSDCAAADEAYQEFAVSSQLILSLRSDQAYAGLINNNPGGFNLDTTSLRANLAVIAKLPDAVSESGDKTSAIIATTRQVLDLIDRNAKSGKPFSDGSGNGQKVLDLWTPLAITQRANLALLAAFKAACAAYTPAPRPTATPQSFAQKTKTECAALNAAIEEFGQQAFVFTALTDDDAYGVFQPGSPFPIDMAALRADLTLFATLPDIADVEVQYHGKPSQLIPIYRQLLAQLEANIKAGSTPFSDGSGNGQKALDLVQAAMGDGRSEVFPATVADVCQ